MADVSTRVVPDLAPELTAIAYEFVTWLKANTSQDEPAPATVIRQEFAMSDLQIRLLVHWLRAKGDPLFSRIGSDSRGYFWIESWSEAQHTLAQLRSRANALHSAVRGICRAFQSDENQPELGL